MALPKYTAGGGSLTREQFLLRELRIVADLRTQGVPDDQIIQRVQRENLFQYRTERMLADRARVCLQRLDALENADDVLNRPAGQPAAPASANQPVAHAGQSVIPPAAPASATEPQSIAARLTEIIAHGSPDAAAQVDFYAMVRRYELVRAFVMGEISERLRSFNYSFTMADMNAFFARYQLENTQAAKWTESTVKRIESTLSNCLVSVGMLDSVKAGNLSPLLLDFEVEELMRANGDADLARSLSGMGAM